MGHDTDVLVVGAGPVGMFTALALAGRGVRVRVVDAHRRTALRSYALALHPGSLRLLDEVGLTADLIDRGHRIERINLYVDCDLRATVELAAVGGDHPYALAIPQYLLEGLLEQKLGQHAVDVAWGHQLLSWDADSAGVTALIARMPGDNGSDPRVETARVRAAYLVGADGYDSFVRRLLDPSWFAVGTAEKYGLLEFECPFESPDTMRICYLGEHTDVFWPLAPTRGRWSVQLGQDEEPPDTAGLKSRVAEHGTWSNGGFGSIEWSSSIDFEPRLAKRFGQERVWLVGDAARFTSPVGVQSMNVGLREGRDLARRLGDILLDGRSGRLLHYYNEERHREWTMLLGIHNRMRVRSEAPGWARMRTDRLVASLPASGPDLNQLLGQLGLRLDWLRRRA